MTTQILKERIENNPKYLKLRERFEELFPKDQEAVEGIRPSKSHRAEALALFAEWFVLTMFFVEEILTEKAEEVGKMKKELPNREGLSLRELSLEQTDYRGKVIGFNEGIKLAQEIIRDGLAENE